MRSFIRILAAATVLITLAGCTSSRKSASRDDTAHRVAERWVAALNASDAHAVASLACRDEGFRAAELASVRAGTDLGPYHYRYVLTSVSVLSPTRASADIDQRLTTALQSRTRQSDLPGEFNILRRGGSWFVCPAGITR